MEKNNEVKSLGTEEKVRLLEYQNKLLSLKLELTQLEERYKKATATLQQEMAELDIWAKAVVKKHGVKDGFINLDYTISPKQEVNE